MRAMSRCEVSRFPDDAETRRKPSHSRQDKTAAMAAFRSAWGPGDRGDRARRPAPSIAQARQGYARKRLRVLASMRWSRRKIRTANAPAAQAPHAPPALTFGLPGKQMVKPVQAGRDFIRMWSSLPENRKFLAIDELDQSPLPPQRARIALLARAFFRQRDLLLQ